jgi:hypothetical protein
MCVGKTVTRVESFTSPPWLSQSMLTPPSRLWEAGSDGFLGQEGPRGHTRQI